MTDTQGAPAGTEPLGSASVSHGEKRKTVRNKAALAACAATVVALIPIGSASANSAQEKTKESAAATGWSNIANRYSGKCLDWDGSEPWNGGTVYLTNCDNSGGQRWYQGTYGDRRVFTSVYDGKVIDAVLENTNGSRITRYRWLEWEHQPRNQQWIWTSAGEIKSAWNGKCLDADPGQKDWSIQRVYLWDCNGSAWQKWRNV
ncbi:RICIN domain-containing protein [Streptomyces sp. NBC_00555]|uniref:RICIN domain-containing protein n=1 Tax=Streptomyces sp. NBC_00555 TaxID=2903662 RepID=UPI00224CD931|nr:RICIN domain-containing protein [Streptomyces sp. NBC_00555]MCX5010459.1 RICIN domain-containing protein [Streptomyces sp. NBC_00555]